MNAGGRFEAIKIILFATLAAIAYGILHDQVTAHLCVEYFTIAHPPLFPTESPFLLALGWGIVATWWVGLPLGIGLATAARMGSAPKLGLAQLRKPILVLMILCGFAALAMGILGGLLVASGGASLPAEWQELIPPAKHAAFSAAAWAHLTSYVCGGLGGVILIGLTVRRRLHV